MPTTQGRYSGFRRSFSKPSRTHPENKKEKQRKDCTALANITIPDSVTEIGYNAFEGCMDLAGITVPDRVNSIGSGAFSGCTGLTSITIPDRVESIGDDAIPEHTVIIG